MKKSNTENIEKKSQACIYKIDDLLCIIWQQKRQLALLAKNKGT